MKKTLMFVCALMTAAISFAQSNVTNGKTVVPLGGLKTYTQNDGVTTYTISQDDLQKITTNGNTSNVFLFPEGGYDTEENRAIGIQGFYIDLGATTSISAIQTTWEGADAGGKVYVTNTQPAANGTLTAATEIAEFSNAQEAAKNATVTVENSGRYIVFVPTEATNYAWGVKIRTFVALDNSAQEVAQLLLSDSFIAKGEAKDVIATAKNKAGADFTGDITWTITPQTGVTREGNVFHFTAEASGVYTITANGVAATVAAVAAPTAPAADDVFQAIYTADVAAYWESVYNGGATAYDEITLGTQKAKPFGDTKCVFFTNTDVWADIYNVNINPTAKQYGKLRLDIYALTDATGKVVLEQTTKIAADNAFTLQAGTWKTVEIDVDGETFIKAMSVRMDNAESILLSNIYFTKAVVSEEAGKIASLAVAPRIVAAGVATPLTLTASDAKGVEIDNANVTYTATGLADVVLTATAGVVTITGTTNEGAQSATATVYAIAAPERTNGADDIEILQSGKSATGQGTDWEGGYTALDNLVYSDNSIAYHATNVTTLYLTNPGISAADLAGFAKLHLDVFTSVDDNIRVMLEGINAEATVQAQAGQWTGIDVPFEGGNAATSWIKIKSENKAELVIDNVYFSKEAAVVPFVINVADGVATVTGPVAAENVAEINAADAIVIDLTGVTEIADPITLTPKNVNALVRVAGTHDGDYAVPTAIYDNLTAKNRVVIDTWVFPVAKMEFVDADGNRFYNGEGGAAAFISTKGAGYTITRSIPADVYVTAAPATNVIAPEGISVYEFTSYSDGQVTFTEKSDRMMTAKTPYVLRDTTAEAIELVVEGTGDLNLTVDAQTVEKDGAKFIANLLPIVTDGTQYVLSNNEIALGNGATVGAFRAYFTGVSAATARFVSNGETTGISNVNIKQNSQTQMFDMQGRRVLTTKTGLYIVNGKKVIIK